MTACWLGPFGAVRLLLRPSWLTALPASSTAKVSETWLLLLLRMPHCSLMTTAASDRT